MRCQSVMRVYFSGMWATDCLFKGWRWSLNQYYILESSVLYLRDCIYYTSRYLFGATGEVRCDYIKLQGETTILHVIFNNSKQICVLFGTSKYCYGSSIFLNERQNFCAWASKM